ncbi:MAG: MarR family transcriptional regulator [Clostridia bacterium]|nr:MarR family transcriptional regulator [Clostridia bacterium]
MEENFKKCAAPNGPMLIHEITHLFQERMRRTTTEPLQTQNSCRLILRSLARMEGCTQLDLVKATHLKPPTVSVTLKKLEDNGFVRREADVRDMRAIRVYLTEKGRDLHQSTIARLRENDAILLDGITPEEQKVLLDILTRMRDNILHTLESESESQHETD